MFEEMIEKLRDITRDLDNKQAKRLKIKQFNNLLIALKDKELIDDTEAAKSVQLMVEEVYEELIELLRSYGSNKVAIKMYRKSYEKLITKVKEVFKLEATGSIQSLYMAIGVALGSSIGAAFMSVTSPGMIGIWVAIGTALGSAIGFQKEKVAKEEGRLY